ncbi:MAG: M16 family metallopeptidase [Spirochaetota bacterium]
MKALLRAGSLLFIVLAFAACGTTSPASGSAAEAQEQAPPGSGERASTAEAGRSSTAEQTDESPVLPVDPLVTVGTLPNGLTYYIRENSEPRDRAFLRLAVNAGSILEDDDQLGLAHFLEHMAFNGTESYSGNEIIAFLERLGMQFGPDVNAYTSFDETVYELSVPTDNAETFGTAMNVLFEWADRLALDEEEIDKERGVIVEEWRFRRGAAARMREEQFPVLFGDSRYADRLPIGDVELIQTFDPEVLRRYYADWYRPELFAIVAVGDFDAGEVEAQILERFGVLTADEDPRPRETFSVPDHEETRFVVAADPETSYTTVSVYVKRDAEALVTEANYRDLLMGSLFTTMFNARLEEITREPDAPFLGAGVSSGSLVRTKAAATIGAAVEGNDVVPALEALVVEARRVTEFGFTTSELERARANLLRSIEQAYRERDTINSERFADEYVRAYLEDEAIPGIPYERELYQRFLPGISLEEVNALAASYLQDENRVVVVSAIESDELAAVDEDDLRLAFERAHEVAVSPYEDALIESELLGTLPPAGTIVNEGELDAEGVLDWRLSNGARVLVLPTDYRADQIVFSAFSPGGSSRVSLEEFRSAQYATAFTEQMGYGEFSPSDLERLLAGTALSVSPYIDTYEEGFSGSASVEDLETMLQLLHLKMTDPRHDQGTFDALRRQFLAVIANQENQPQFQFSRRFQQLYSNDHPRTLPVDRAGLESISLDSVLSIYRERFADASDFTFVFVGTVDPAAFRPLVEQYIASLPSTRSDPGWRDVGVRRPDGVVADTVRAGIEPISEVVVAFHGGYEFSQDSNYAIRALERMLSIRMQEVIREDESGTYGVGVQAQFTRIPEERYTILVTFRSSPDRIDELTGRVFDVIEEVRSEVPDQSYVERIQETQEASFREQLTNNQFWLGQVEFAVQNDRSMSAIRRYLDLVAALEPQDIRSAAERYLDLERYVQVTLMPAEE